MPLKPLTAALSIVWLMFMTACASEATSKSAGGLRPVPPLAADIDRCEDAKDYPAGTAEARPSGVLRGWVVLAYALSEDGKPDQVRVVDSEPKGELVPGALQSLARTPFKRGIRKDLCVDVITVFRR